MEQMNINEQVDRSSKLPLYYQLYEILRKKIIKGEWKPGDLIPSETEMIQTYGVSRITVRQVLDMFVREGMIHRQRGKGTFVSMPSLESNPGHITSFSEDMLQRGMEPETQVLSQKMLPAPQDIAQQLNILPEKELVLISRLRLVNGTPLSLEECYLVHDYCPDILLKHDYAKDPLRLALEKDYGIRIARAKQAVRAILADQELADQLKVAKKSPILFVERISYTPNDTPVEFLRIYYRADRYVLYNELQG